MLKYPDIFDDWYVRYKPEPGICNDSWIICLGWKSSTKSVNELQSSELLKLSRAIKQIGWRLHHPYETNFKFIERRNRPDSRRKSLKVHPLSRLRWASRCLWEWAAATRDCGQGKSLLSRSKHLRWICTEVSLKSCMRCSVAPSASSILTRRPNSFAQVAARWFGSRGRTLYASLAGRETAGTAKWLRHRRSREYRTWKRARRY